MIPPLCTCLEHEGDDSNCPIHGICYEDRRQDDAEREAEDRRNERDRQSEISFARYGGWG